MKSPAHLFFTRICSAPDHSFQILCWCTRKWQSMDIITVAGSWLWFCDELQLFITVTHGYIGVDRSKSLYRFVQKTYIRCIPVLVPVTVGLWSWCVRKRGKGRNQSSSMWKTVTFKGTTLRAQFAFQTNQEMMRFGQLSVVCERKTGWRRTCYAEEYHI